MAHGVRAEARRAHCMRASARTWSLTRRKSSSMSCITECHISSGSSGATSRISSSELHETGYHTCRSHDEFD